ncbi:Uncharacterised protein [Salmonella enterica subsp. enterica]|nr:Uncharacterised protein [Salmonella enterica subsp. enterica]
MADVYCRMNVVVVGLISVAPSGNPEQVAGWQRERLIRPTFSFSVGQISKAPFGNPLLGGFIKFAQHIALIGQRFFAVKLVFPLGDHQHRQRIPHHI